MSQFKPGDLAIILKTLGTIEAGSVVELEELILPGELVTWEPSGEKFVAKARGWIVLKGETRAAVGEYALMPLRGDSQPEQQKREEVPA